MLVFVSDGINLDFDAKRLDGRRLRPVWDTSVCRPSEELHVQRCRKVEREGSTQLRCTVIGINRSQRVAETADPRLHWSQGQQLQYSALAYRGSARAVLRQICAALRWQHDSRMNRIYKATTQAPRWYLRLPKERGVLARPGQVSSLEPDGGST